MCMLLLMCFFFFKQKTAYEMLRSLVGSEMCIRDRVGPAHQLAEHRPVDRHIGALVGIEHEQRIARPGPVSYTHLTLPTIYSV